MSFLSLQNYDKKSVVKIIALVDLVQCTLIMLTKGGGIIFRPMLSEEDSLVLRQNQSSTVVVILFVLTMSFCAVHMTMALKLLSSIELMERDLLMAARNAKVWQNWSILFLVFLLGYMIASVLSASTKLGVTFVVIFYICEIIWRLFGIYNVGLFINELIVNIPFMIPTVQFFGVRFPAPIYSASLERLPT